MAPRRATVSKDWTAERAMKEQERAVANGLSFSDPTGPVFQWAALHRLDDLKKRFDEGDKFALFQAIAACARCELPLQEWAIESYLKGFYRITAAEKGSLDEVFGRPYPKKTHLKTLRDKRNLSLPIYQSIEKLRGPNRPLNNDLYKEVGKKFGVGKTACAELYKYASRMFPNP